MSQRNEDNKTKPFSISRRLKSFHYAGQGLQVLFREEHNAWLHLVATGVVIGLAILYPVTHMEGIALVIVTAGVWITELLNTAIERSMDLISTASNPKIKIIKDLAAAAVLVMAIAALVTGCIIFIPKLIA